MKAAVWGFTESSVTKISSSWPPAKAFRQKSKALARWAPAVSASAFRAFIRRS